MKQYYLLFCEECGTVYEVPVSYFKNLEKQAVEKTGFVIIRHRTVFEGLCLECQYNNMGVSQR